MPWRLIPQRRIRNYPQGFPLPQYFFLSPQLSSLLEVRKKLVCILKCCCLRIFFKRTISSL
ncbi:hypothetical protein DB42_CY00070 [Neochlamydia sp. EPS4]|nr:hypothetical protein DB42_CY00070 [Neochlamydia sp. EPS4]